MSDVNVHSAGGPFVGYLFQVDRALHRLALLSRRDAAIVLEADDDLVEELAGGDLRREQLKNTIVPGRNPFSDRSADLWKTLGIWASAIADKTLDLNTTELVFVTNATVSEDGLAAVISRADDPESCVACVTKLREVAANPSATIAKHVAIVTAQSDKELQALVQRVHLVDGALTGDELEAELLALIPLPASLTPADAYHSLLGWLHDNIVSQLRLGGGARVTREAYLEQVQAIMRRASRSRLRPLAEALVGHPGMEISGFRAATFVRQLVLLDLDEVSDAYCILQACKEFTAAADERARLVRDGNFTQGDFIEFNDRLVQKWAVIAARGRRLVRDNPSRADEIHAGLSILYDSLSLEMSLAGVELEQEYLTKGCLHELADRQQLGWHPRYQEELAEL